MVTFYSQSIPRNVIGTVAGTGEPGYAGDGGPAVEACLNEPKHVTLDTSNNLYIADSENHVIRKVDGVTGLISTVAGCSMSFGTEPAAAPSSLQGGMSPDDEDPFAETPDSSEDRYVQVTDLSGTVRFVVGSGLKVQGGVGDGGPAVKASLHFPSAVAVKGESLYIADTMGHRIREVDLKTGIIRTLVGTGQRRFSGDGGPASHASLNEPCALALDGQGNLYIADQSNNRIRKVDLTTEIITTVAGTGESAYSGDGGQGTDTCLAGPSGLARGSDGHLYIADTFNGRIRQLDLATGVIRTVIGDGGTYRYAGNPVELSTSLSRPSNLVVQPDGHILITDSDNHLIRKWDCRKKTLSVLAGIGQAQYSGDGGHPDKSGLSFPFGVAVDRENNVFIADTFNHRVRMVAVSP